jgi:hypothetical protein
MHVFFRFFSPVLSYGAALVSANDDSSVLPKTNAVYYAIQGCQMVYVFSTIDIWNGKCLCILWPLGNFRPCGKILGPLVYC